MERVVRKSMCLFIYKDDDIAAIKNGYIIDPETSACPVIGIASDMISHGHGEVMNGRHPRFNHSEAVVSQYADFEKGPLRFIPEEEVWSYQEYISDNPYITFIGWKNKIWKTKK